MKPRILDRTVRAGDIRQGRTNTRSPLILLAGLALMLSLPPAAKADVVWQDLWTENFDHSMNDGWNLQAYAAGDRVEVVAEGTRFRDRALRCDPDNNVLYGKATDPGRGHGFSASTPGFDALGMRNDVWAYEVEFRYMVLGSDFCWTVPLASPDVILVVSECLAGGTRARLGIVDKTMLKFRPVAEISVDEWHHFHIRVRHVGYGDAREVKVELDGEVVAAFLQTERNYQQGLTFMDLPAFPDGDHATTSPPVASRACFGSGYWDDIALRALQEDSNPGVKTKRQIRVEPNPFNPATTIRLSLDLPTPLDVRVFDLRGQLVRVLYADRHPAGEVLLRWNGTDARGRAVASGTYLIRSRTPENSSVTRATLIK